MEELQFGEKSEWTRPSATFSTTVPT